MVLEDSVEDFFQRLFNDQRDGRIFEEVFNFQRGFSSLDNENSSLDRLVLGT